MPEPVRTESSDGVLVITIARPQSRNAVDRATAEGIAAALDRLDADPELRAGIVTGAGGYFSAGMDLKAFAAGERSHAGGRGFAGIVERPPETPLIAAIEGLAVAGGFEIALACDLIVAARGARLGIPEVKRSLVAAGGALLRLPARISHQVAMELALTGDPISAERAHALGLVNRLAEPGAALAGARELAAAIIANGPLALRATKRILSEAPEWPADERWTRQTEIAAPVFASDDAREGAVAFAEKRARLARPLSGYSPQSVTSSDRAPPSSRCSHRYTPCQVPSAKSPSRTGRVSDGPSSEALMCAGMSSGPSIVCVQ
jgi:enoyl-CoA hydratase